MWSKPLVLNAYPTPTSLRRFCGATDKLKPTWFWGPNQETVAVILRPKSPNRSCRFWGPNHPHTTPPDLLIAWPPSTQPVWPSLILCIRSPTPATILVATHHAAPVTCTPWDKQTWFSKRNKDKRKIKRDYLEFKFKPRQVNDSSQSNQETGDLVSHSSLATWAKFSSKSKPSTCE
jgi:hypothetical protein